MHKLKFLSYIFCLYISILQFALLTCFLGTFAVNDSYANELNVTESKATTRNDSNSTSTSSASVTTPDIAKGKIQDVKKLDNEINDIFDKDFDDEDKLNDVKKEDNSKVEAENLIDNVAPLENSNLNVVLLLDTSGSMSQTDPERLRDEGVRLFLQFLKDGDKVSIVEFSDKTKVLMEPSFFNKDGLDTLSQGLTKIENKGQYTDIYNAIKEANQLLTKKIDDNEGEYQNVIVLFSDGKLEPNEDIISKEDALKKLNEELIPELKENNTKLYTLSFSDKSDKDLLKSLAENTGAMSWFAPNADAIHESFSKIFLSVQKPQILPISDKGLRIDGQIEEATFYLNVKENKEMVIISPSGRKIVKGTPQNDVKWFSGNKFEIITVEKPEAGLWNFIGSISKDDFATVLTQLKLVTAWPYSITAGEDNELTARVYDGKKPLVLPEVSKLATVAFRVTPTDRISAPVLEGVLNDDGMYADKKALDCIFTTKISIETPGEYELWLVVKTSTFERHQKIPFIVKPRLITLAEPIKLDNGETEFQVLLNDDALNLKNLNVYLSAKKINKTFDIPLKQDKENSLLLKGLSRYLKEQGTYNIFATLSAHDKTGKAISVVTKPLEFTNGVISGIPSPEVITEDSNKNDKQQDLSNSDNEAKEKSFAFEQLTVALANIFIIVFIFVLYKKKYSRDGEFDMSRLIVSDDILATIKEFEEKSKVQDVDVTSFVFVDEDNKNENIDYENVTSINDSNNKTDDTKDATEKNQENVAEEKKDSEDKIEEKAEENREENKEATESQKQEESVLDDTNHEEKVPNADKEKKEEE